MWRGEDGREGRGEEKREVVKWKVMEKEGRRNNMEGKVEEGRREEVTNGKDGKGMMGRREERNEGEAGGDERQRREEKRRDGRDQKR